MKAENSPSLSAKSVRKKTAKNKKIDVSALHGTPGVRWTKTCANIKIFFHCFFFFFFTYTTDFTEKRGPLVSHLQCYPHFIPFLNAGRNNCFKNILKNLFRFKISSNNFSFLFPLCILFAFTRSVCDFANKPITSKNSDLDIGKLTWTFFAYLLFCFHRIWLVVLWAFVRANLLPFVWNFNKFRSFYFNQMLWFI